MVDCPMPYFIIIPVWLAILACAGVLTFIRNTRRLAAYIAVCSTSALVVSIVVSTLALILTAKLPWNSNGSVVGGVVMIGSYLGGIVAGAVLGAALGFWGLYRLMNMRARES